MYEEVFKLHAQLLKSIAHPRRLEIIHLLRDQSLLVSQIVEMLDLPQANISQHLQILRNAEVVEAEKDGKNVRYRIAHKKFLQASDLIRDVLVEQYKNDPKINGFADSMLDMVPVVHDPVCQMRVSPKTAGFAARYKNITYYFCASGCKKKFLNNPSEFI